MSVRRTAALLNVTSSAACLRAETEGLHYAPRRHIACSVFCVENTSLSGI